MATQFRYHLEYEALLNLIILLLWYHHHKMAESDWDTSLLKLPKADKSQNTNKITQEQLIEQLMYGDEPINNELLETSSKPVPKSCPFGLEPLHHANKSLIVLRRPENSLQMPAEKRLLAFAQYDIVDSEGHQLYVAVEQTTRRALKWTRDARTFNVTMYDHSCKKILTIRRPCSLGFCCAQYYCFLCLFGFKGCGNNAIVTLCEGNKKLGRISQEFSCNQTILRIYDESDNNIMYISGKFVEGMFDIWNVQDDDEPVAMIDSSMTAHEISAFYKIQVSNYEDPYGLTFFRLTLSPKYKVLIIAAIILMDYIYCKPNTDFPHYLQVIPSDFKPEDQIREQLFTDGSKEILITSYKPTNNKINTLRTQRFCGCFRWFLSLICLCCPLGFARNGCRCVCLVIFVILLIAGALSLIAVYILVSKK